MTDYFRIFIPDVEDGLAVGIRIPRGITIQIDCGSQERPDLALEKGLLRNLPDFFILSHFHVDHYNGLFEHRKFHKVPPQQIHKVYYPRIPEFKDRKRFLACLLSINARVIGASTGSQEADLLAVISSINRNSFYYEAVSQGDIISAIGANFSVLWPPKVLDNEATIKAVSKAITAFDDAIAQDKIMRDIHSYIGDKGIFDRYLNDKIMESEELRTDKNTSELILHKGKPLPKAVDKANKLLRAVANRFSLAFKETNQLLFLGDLEAREINSVVNDLICKNQRRFRIIITPHHGTHWHNSLYKIRADAAISSVGKKLIRNFRTEHQIVADNCLATFVSGDVDLPLNLYAGDYPTWGQKRRLFHYYRII